MIYDTLSYHTPLVSNDLRALEIPAPWGFGMADVTRFGELDALGHINNTAYLKWLENLRVNYFREYKVADYSGQPPRLVLKSIAMDYRKEMGLHEPYVVTGRTARMRTSSFTMEYAVWSGDLRATGSAVIVWLDHTGQKHTIPDPVREKFIATDGCVDDR
ncbi:MAG: acyl-CoA thioesterase [Planktomarina sp.]